MVGLATLVLVGCGIPNGRRPGNEPPTDVVLQPEVVGVVTKWEHLGSGKRFTLDTGHVVELYPDDSEDRPPTPRLSASDVNVAWQTKQGERIAGPSVLLLVGHYPDGTAWYAAAPQTGEEMDWSDEPCPFKIRGASVYDEDSVLHFSTGLVLPKAQDFRLDFDMNGVDEFPLNAGDEVCIDQSGTALWVYVWWPR
jgi:hypothetical protein